MESGPRSVQVARSSGLVVALAAAGTASLLAWVLASQPSLIMNAVSANDGGAIVSVVFDVLCHAFSNVIQSL